MKIIEITGLCKTYFAGDADTRIDALRDISLSVESGEFVAVMGPSGSGKSTLLNMLGCLDTPDRGRYLLGEEDISRMDDDTLSAFRGRRIGFVFQAYHLIPQLSVEENISIPLYYQGISEKECQARARNLAEKVGLADRLTHTSTQLSGGQQQRVAIARALASDPLLILADEPTGNLDSQTGREIMNLLMGLNRDGKTLVIVTHDDEVAAEAGRLIRMHDGMIVGDESVRGLEDLED